MRKRLLWVLLPLMLLVACARVPLSEEVLGRVDPTVEFADVKANAEKYRGSTVLLGGQIVDNQATREGSVLEILRYHVDKSGRPMEVDEAGGRFLARSERFLDPEVYESGKFVTLAGTVAGQETKPLKGIDYTYPFFEVEEIHLWREPLGYGYGYPGYYSPYYYGPPHYYSPYYDPFWYPFGPPWRYRDPLWRYHGW